MDENLEGVEDGLFGLGDTDLEGIGRVLYKQNWQKMQPAQKQNVKAIAQGCVKEINRRHRGVAARNLGGRPFKALLLLANRLSLDDQKALKEGQLQTQEQTAYHRAKIVAGDNSMLEGTSGAQPTVGLTTFNNNRVPKDVNILATDVQLKYGRHATKADPRDIGYTNYTPIDGTTFEPTIIPTAVLNGELIIKDTSRIVAKIAARKFFVVGNANVNSPKDGQEIIVQLPTPLLLKADQTLEIQFRCANGIALPGGNHFIETTFIGVVTVPR